LLNHNNKQESIRKIILANKYNENLKLETESKKIKEQNNKI